MKELCRPKLHSELKDEAAEAIVRLFSDQSASRIETTRDMWDLRGLIDMNLDFLDGFEDDFEEPGKEDA